MNAIMEFKEQQRKFGFDTEKLERLKEAVGSVSMLNDGAVLLVNLKAHLNLN